MEFSKHLLGDDSLKVCNEHGELLPDPNLIWNIEHLVGFIEIELELWRDHCIKVEEDMNGIPDYLKGAELLSNARVRVYIKSLYDISNYFISCVEALDRLFAQVNGLNNRFNLNVKKPKLEADNTFYKKVKYIRNISFVHQASDRENNPMNKRVAMSWMPKISHRNDEVPNCENYIFGDGKWWVTVNGMKKESDIDISITGFCEFAQTALTQIKVHQSRIVDYYTQLNRIQKSKSLTESAK